LQNSIGSLVQLAKGVCKLAKGVVKTAYLIENLHYRVLKSAKKYKKVNF
jgi:hypothetical protein